ncbi:MAG: toll/interleukin-1 receptor domain-containing protein, partial [Myxococcota bacterium]
MTAFDAFISYNSDHSEQVRRLVFWLKQMGQRVWLDQERLAPGSDLIDEIHRGLRSGAACLVCIGPQGKGPWQSIEVKQLIVRAIRNPDFVVVPVLMPGATQADISQHLPLSDHLTIWTYPHSAHENAARSLRALVCGMHRHPLGNLRWVDDQVAQVAGGTGYALGNNLVLTAADTVGESIDVRFVREVMPCSARVLRVGPDSTALLQLLTPRAAASPPVVDDRPVTVDAVWSAPVVVEGQLRIFDGRLSQGRLKALSQLPSEAVGAPIFIEGALAGMIDAVDSGMGRPVWHMQWKKDEDFFSAFRGPSAPRISTAPSRISAAPSRISAAPSRISAAPSRREACEQFDVVIEKRGGSFIATVFDDRDQPLREAVV